MVRQIRVENAGAKYPAIKRGNRRGTIFAGDAERYHVTAGANCDGPDHDFLNLLGEATGQFGIRIHAYVS